ncbi:MAG: 2Fe-2S iron-sulfur cluster binding domain-containing protein [Deltaproteobacteria bacterium]|nr:2Fe-2S iron-sulfur cluster binding domain-containing protein [Deltaproteobacteria bacterium]
MLQTLIGLLVLGGIAAVLALLLEIAYAFIADYGECHVIINEEKDLAVEGGSPLLATLAEQGIFIPSGCGGKGTCSLCKLRVLEGGGPLLPTETPYLNPEEREGNVRLSCQVKVRNDLRIQIPEELFLVKEFRVSVEDIRELTPAIRGVRFAILSPEEGITFKPGQYLQLRIPKYKLSKEPEFRAYSISSSARDRHAVELVITKAPDGVVSTYVHDFLKKGDELTVTGPFGDFFLRDGDRGILLIATGSGLAPVKSILHQVEEERIERKTTLFFGAKTPNDLYYFDRLREFEKTVTGFKLMPVLSRTTEADEWEGEKGRVTDLIKKYIPDNAGVDVYICGSPVMVQSCVEVLTAKGVPEERIFFDEFE